LTRFQVRRALKGFINDNPEYERLLPFVKGACNTEKKMVDLALT
jgi:hypothetical protein